MKNITKDKTVKLSIIITLVILLIITAISVLNGDIFRYGYTSDGMKVRPVYEITADGHRMAYAKSEKDANKIINSLIKNLEKEARIEGIQSSNLKIRKADLKLSEHPKIPDVKTAIAKADTKKIKAKTTFTEEDVIYYTTVEKESEEYRKGVKAVSSLGQNGLSRNTYSVSIADNEIKETKLISSEVIEKPSSEIILVSTADQNKYMHDSGGNIIDVPETVRKASSMQYIPCTATENIENSETYKQVQGSFKWDGNVLTKSRGAINDGPNGRETYYNLNMSGVVRIMRGMGNNDPYWVRSDGMKMLGNYIMVAANLNIHPRGSIVKCSNGWAIVCDTGGFAKKHPNALDIAVNW